MITEDALKEAILACEGDLDPNANTCRTLAALYTIQDHMYPDAAPRTETYSGQAPRRSIALQGDAREAVSDFLELAYMVDPDTMLDIIDELMSTVSLLVPRLYDGVMRRLRDNI